MIRANMWSLCIPKQYTEPFTADTRALTVDSLASILEANMRFGLPADGKPLPPELVTL